LNHYPIFYQRAGQVYLQICPAKTSIYMVEFSNLIAKSYQRSIVYYAAKFKHVLNLLGGSYQHSQNNDFILLLNRITSTQFAERQSTFLWLNIHRVFSSYSNEDIELIERNKNYFIVLAFDAMFDILPKKTEIVVSKYEDSALFLPLLGIKFKSDDLPISLEKLGERELCFKSIDTLQVIKLDTPKLNPDCVFRKKLIYSESSVIYERHVSIFEEMYHDEVTADPTFCGNIEQELVIAMEMISKYDINLHEQICKIVKWFVPIGTPLRERYFSFTSAMMKDTIFLSLLRKDIALMEDIIHEFKHIELSYFMDSQTLFEPEFDYLYYSPWKFGPRPLAALIHAIYVFTHCLHFYSKINLSDLTEQQRSFILNRVIELYHKVDIGLRQVPLEKLTREGIILYKGVEHDLIRIKTCFNITSDVPPHLNEHLETWRKNNPALIAN
jgi:hypothetical protein